MTAQNVVGAVRNYLNYRVHLARVACMGRLGLNETEMEYLLAVGTYNSEDDVWLNGNGLGYFKMEHQRSQV